jgi:hypothetical protein
MPALSNFLGEGATGLLAMIAQAMWILQLALVIHVYRTGRPYWWTFILFSAPIIGGLAYFFIEISPELRTPSGHGFFYRLMPRKWRIADLRAEIEETDTVENRFALAEELADGEMHEEAHDVAAECLRGVFKDDPHTLATVARYKIEIARFADAIALLDRVDTQANRRLALQVGLSKGDALLGLKRFSEAETYYRGINGLFIGEAPRFGLASIMEKTGRKQEAIALWKDIRTKFRKASPAWRRSEKRWYKLATAKLKAQQA